MTDVLPWTGVRRCDWWRRADGVVVFRCPSCSSPRQLAHAVDKWGYVTPRVFCTSCDAVYELFIIDWPYGAFDATRNGIE